MYGAQSVISRSARLTGERAPKELPFIRGTAAGINAVILLRESYLFNKPRHTHIGQRREGEGGQKERGDDSGVEIIIIMIWRGAAILFRENDRGTYVTHAARGTYI